MNTWYTLYIYIYICMYLIIIRFIIYVVRNHYRELSLFWFIVFLVLYTHWKRWSRVRKTFNENKKRPQKKSVESFRCKHTFCKAECIIKIRNLELKEKYHKSKGFTACHIINCDKIPLLFSLLQDVIFVFVLKIHDLPPACYQTLSYMKINR